MRASTSSPTKRRYCSNCGDLFKMYSSLLSCKPGCISQPSLELRNCAQRINISLLGRSHQSFPEILSSHRDSAPESLFCHSPQSLEQPPAQTRSPDSPTPWLQPSPYQMAPPIQWD